MALYEPRLQAVIDAAFARLLGTLDRAGPTVAAQVLHWMDRIGGRVHQLDSYKHPLSYPMLLLPWWAEKNLHTPPDTLFQTDLAYSTINGYYAIRLIDNLMDQHGTIELDLLPVLHIFEAEFIRTYQAHFPAGHAFWRLLDATWSHCSEVTLRDAGAGQIDREHFTEVTAHKTEAAKIPIAAVCYRYERPDLIRDWTDVVRLFGCWHQMANDLFDWRKDDELGTRTYFLAEAQRRSRPSEPLIAWVAREGFAWAMGLLEGWMAELRERACTLGCSDLDAYLAARDQMLRQKRDDLAPGLVSAARLFDALRAARK